MNKPEKIIIHHEAGNNGFESVNRMHKNKWNFESELGYFIGYQWYYDKKKGWIQGRSEDEEGAHCLDGWNRKSIGVCFQGNYENEPFLLKKEFDEKIKDIRSRWGNLPISGHRENQKKKTANGNTWATLCPGKNLQAYLEEFRKTETEKKIMKKIIKLLTKLIKKIKGQKK